MKNLIKRLFSRSESSQAEQPKISKWETDIALVTCVDESGGENRERHYFSILPPDQTFKHGLIPQAIVGECTEKPVEGEAVDRSKFVANTVFKDFLHKVIESCADHPEIVSEAMRIGRGMVTVIDRRVPDLNAAIAPEDIIGGFTVENGRITGYSRNPHHVLLNQFGFLKLDPIIQIKLNKAFDRILENK
ncbi:hypothetical protein EGT07_11850 [Herbaspirillum sp. HC18]|nr:hypothetical protein EGT07_11850 [Herbaspirillum sp. HC18]